MRLHPKTDAVQRLIAEGLNNTEIGRTLHIERQTAGHIRRALGLPNAPRQPLTLEEKWEANTRPVDGGHLEWTGERQSDSGTPVLRYREKPHSPAAIAFRIKHQREPAGYAYAECGLKHCVAPDHVDDEAGRTRTREQLRYLTGGKERPPQCAHGHDQAKWGRYETDGRAYCHACKADRKHAERQAVAH